MFELDLVHPEDKTSEQEVNSVVVLAARDIEEFQSCSSPPGHGEAGLQISTQSTYITHPQRLNPGSALR